MAGLIGWLRSLSSLARVLAGLGAGRRRPATVADDRDVAEILGRALAAHGAGHLDEARTLYRHAAARGRGNVDALRGLRDIAVQSGDWEEAFETQQRVLALAPPEERASEEGWLATRHYERGLADLGAGQPAAAAGHFRSALKIDRHFLPAAVALGDAQEALGEHREAVRTWERAADAQSARPLLARLERAYREEGRPSRMIAVYRGAAERAPDDLSLAAGLGRVYFELEMLDEAADQFEKIEVRAPDSPVVHAFLGAVFERRGETAEAFEEYRRALRLAHAFDWPHRCQACGAEAPTWRDRCARCGRWNVFRPSPGP